MHEPSHAWGNVPLRSLEVMLKVVSEVIADKSGRDPENWFLPCMLQHAQHRLRRMHVERWHSVMTGLGQQCRSSTGLAG